MKRGTTPKTGEAHHHRANGANDGAMDRGVNDGAMDRPECASPVLNRAQIVSSQRVCQTRKYSFL